MKKLWIFVCIVLIGVVGHTLWTDNRKPADKQDNTAKVADKASATGFDTKQHSLDDPESIWVIANKLNPLEPKAYEPEDLVVPDMPLRSGADSPEMQLRKEPAKALEDMYAAAKREARLELMVSSAYRSYGYQVNLYGYYVKVQGQETADTQSARPGYSEHQTGLAVDIGPASRECEVKQCFGELPEGKWVAANAHRFGFIIRYPQDKQDVTGYIYEPWHLRYVGTSLAKEIYAKNTTLEQFFGLPHAPDYK